MAIRKFSTATVAKSSKSSALLSGVYVGFKNGWLLGGTNGAGTNIEVMSFSAETFWKASSTITSTSYAAVFCDSGVNCFASGGDSNTLETSKINVNTFVKSSGGSLSASRTRVHGVSNSGTAGYAMGGYSSGTIMKYPYSTDTWANTSATMWNGSSTTDRTVGVNNAQIASYHFGGTAGGTATNIIGKFLFSNDTRSNLAATLTNATYTGSVGINTGVAAYYFGGYPPFNTNIDKLTLSTETKSALSATLTSQNLSADAGTFSSDIASFVCAGYPAIAYSTSVNKLLFSTEVCSLSTSASTSVGSDGRFGASNNGKP
jgi:hypothetical protein